MNRDRKVSQNVGQSAMFPRESGLSLNRFISNRQITIINHIGLSAMAKNDRLAWKDCVSSYASPNATEMDLKEAENCSEHASEVERLRTRDGKSKVKKN